MKIKNNSPPFLEFRLISLTSAFYLLKQKSMKQYKKFIKHLSIPELAIELLELQQLIQWELSEVLYQKKNLVEQELFNQMLKDASTVHIPIQ